MEGRKEGGKERGNEERRGEMREGEKEGEREGRREGGNEGRLGLKQPSGLHPSHREAKSSNHKTPYQPWATWVQT